MNELPPRVQAAEERRAFRELLSRSSLGCPRTISCGHMLSEHDVTEQDEDTLRPLQATCTRCDCEVPE